MDAKNFMPDVGVIAGIRENLQSYEGHRIGAHAKVRWRVPLFVALVVAAALLVAWWFNQFADRNEQWLSTPHIWLYFGALAGCFFAYSAAMKPATELQQGLRNELLPIAFGFVKDLRYRRNITPDSFANLPRDVVGHFNRQHFDDVISGTYEDFEFELYEAKLEYKAGKNTSTMFQGVIIAFPMITPFPGLFVVSRHSGQVTKFFTGLFGGGKLGEVEAGIPELDNAYDFRSDNEAAARSLVGGKLAQALRWLIEAWPERPGLVAVSGRDGFLLLPLVKNFFELPGISVPLDYKAHVEPMIADLAALLATAALLRKAGAADEPEGAVGEAAGRTSATRPVGGPEMDAAGSAGAAAQP